MLFCRKMTDLERRPVTPEVAGSSPVAPVPQISLAVSAAAAGMPPLCSGLMKEVAHFGV